MDAQRLVTALLPITQALQTLAQSLAQSQTHGGGPTQAPTQLSPQQGSPVQQMPHQHSPVQQSPVQQTPVQQSPIQSGPPMKGAPQKVTQGGGPQYIPPAPETKKFVLIPRPQPEVQDKPRKRRGSYGGGGGDQVEHQRPVSVIRAQQNVGKDLVNRGNRIMKTDYSDRKTDREGGNRNETSTGRVSNRSAGAAARDRDHGTSPSGHKKTAPGSRNGTKKSGD